MITSFDHDYEILHSSGGPMQADNISGYCQDGDCGLCEGNGCQCECHEVARKRDVQRAAYRRMSIEETLELVAQWECIECGSAKRPGVVCPRGCGAAVEAA